MCFTLSHHGEITFSLIYAFSENFMLPLSHDEVVHGKGALIDRMPGDEWQRFANLRLLFGYMFAHPGAQLLFMGGEFGQTSEWSIEKGLDWWLLDFDYHQGVRQWIAHLNQFYRNSPALYEKQFDPNGFEWIDHGDWQNSLLTFLRRGDEEESLLVVACNFTPVVRETYNIGVPFQGKYTEVLNSDDKDFGGAGHHKNGTVETKTGEWNGRPFHIEVKMPPLSVIVFELEELEKAEEV